MTKRHLMSLLLLALPSCNREQAPAPSEPLASFRLLIGKLKPAFEAQFQHKPITVDEPSWLEEKERLVETENYRNWSGYSQYYDAIRVGDREQIKQALASVPTDERRVKYEYEYSYEVTWGELDARKTDSLEKPFVGSVDFKVVVSRVKQKAGSERETKPLRFFGTADDFGDTNLFRFFYRDGRWEPDVHKDGSPKGWIDFKQEFRRTLEEVNRM